MRASKFDQQNRTQILESTLDLLEAVETGESMSQRGLASRLGIALGLTNSLVKRCIRMGILKVREAPARRFAYYLTPRGFAEKSLLTAEYLSSSLHFFRKAREQYSETTSYCVARDWKKIALCGGGELSEIAFLALQEAGCKPVAIIDPGRNSETLFDVKIVRSLAEARALSDVEAVIVTDYGNPQKTYDFLVDSDPELPVLAPPLLRVRGKTARKTGEEPA